MTLLQSKENQHKGLNAGEESSSAPVLLSGDLGGMTLAPGRYRIESALLIKQGDLTLDACGDANATWTFETDSIITTTGGAGGNVVLEGGASIKNVVWRIGSTNDTTSPVASELSPGLSPNKISASMLARQAGSRFKTRSLAFFNFKNHKSMNTNISNKVGLGFLASCLSTKAILFFGALFIITGFTNSTTAQVPTYAPPSFWIGAAAGGNFNFYRGTTQQLNGDLTVPAAFHHGKGLGLYVAPLIEFHRPDSRWGVMLQAGYDSRKGKFDQVTTPCNCPADLSTNLSYITIEPSLRLAPFKGNFYLYAGPRFAFNRDHAFTYKLGLNPAIPDQAPTPDVKGDFDNMDNMLISMQVGAGYDIQLSSGQKPTFAVLSPFVAFHPYFGQSPRTEGTWTLTSVRVGAALKFGRGKEIEAPVTSDAPAAAVAAPQVTFSVNSPMNIPVERRVRETFPILNSVFFDLGSTEIPDRYVLLRKSELADFSEDQLEVFTPKRLTGRSDRLMTAYYNLLNILGDRMVKNPSASITLVGSSEKGNADGRQMSESVKKYLVDVFGIAASRITTEGRSKPKLPSEQRGGTQELDLLREEDRRVSIESGSPALLMEFQSGPSAPLKPVEIAAVQVAPVDSYVSFVVDGANEAFTSWSLEVKDDSGKTQNFGPYTREMVNLPGKDILGTKPEGDYKMTMTGMAKQGGIQKKDTTVNMVLWAPSQDEQGMRYSIVYNFNDSKAISMYEKYLAEVVTPKIPANGSVYIHGYTDEIGSEVNNERLALARANDVRKIIEKSLAKAGRKDVTFKVLGFGEDADAAHFTNGSPEERFYNRAVLVDIIPAK